jgi:hypothetical protein
MLKRILENSGLLGRQKLTLGLLKTVGFYSVTERLLISEEGLGSMESVS